MCQLITSNVAYYVGNIKNVRENVDRPKCLQFVFQLISNNLIVRLKIAARF